jgi:hypothetical protein
MMTQQQIIGVSDRLGANLDSMQGTTRAIYDSQPGLGAGGTRRFFENVQTRPYPFSNISQNRFETGESLAIESIALLSNGNVNFVDFVSSPFSNLNQQIILNLYIGNQRVLKDLDLTYAINQIGTTNTIGQDNTAASNYKAVVYLESPIVIPPLIEFYADITTSLGVGGTSFNSLNLILQGTGTLLNTQKNF